MLRKLPGEGVSALASRAQVILASHWSIDTLNTRLSLVTTLTVDVEDGQEVRPHHYIRSILPQGPVGCTNTFWNGDQLLEVIVGT